MSFILTFPMSSIAVSYFFGLALALRPIEVINPFPDIPKLSFDIVQTFKFQRDVQGGILITTLDLSVFPNITMTTIFHDHSCEITKCELILA